MTAPVSPPPLEALKLHLQERSQRLTGPRRAVLEALRGHRRPLSIRELFAALPAGECDLATVYRSLHLLRRLGMVQRFDLGDGRARFTLVPPGASGHHHHLICTRCAAVVALDECFPPEFEERIAAHNGYRSVTHRLEFFGVCPRCQ